MSKTTTRSQRGPRINPAASPTTPASPAAAAGTSVVAASAKTTAGPAKPGPQPKRATAPIQPATNEPNDFNDASLKDELMTSLGIGSDDATNAAAAAEALQDGAPLDEDDRDGDDGEATADEAIEDETPVSDEASAEDDASGEATAEATHEAGDNDSPENNENTDEQTAAEDAAAMGDDDALDALARERKWPKSYLRRLKQVSAKARDELAARDAEVVRLRDEVESLRKNPNAAPAVVTDLEQKLTSEIAAAEKVLDFVDDNPNGATTPDGREWTREELRAERRAAERALRDKEDDLRHLRQTTAAKQREVEALLPVRHPNLKDRTSDHSRAMDTLLGQFPVLKSNPVLRLMASDAVAFALQLQRQQKAKPEVNGANGHANGAVNGRGVTPARPLPAGRGPTKPRSQALPVNGARVQARTAEQKFFENGDSTAGRQLIESMLGDN